MIDPNIADDLRPRSQFKEIPLKPTQIVYSNQPLARLDSNRLANNGLMSLQPSKVPERVQEFPEYQHDEMEQFY